MKNKLIGTACTQFPVLCTNQDRKSCYKPMSNSIRPIVSQSSHRFFTSAPSSIDQPFPNSKAYTQRRYSGSCVPFRPFQVVWLGQLRPSLGTGAVTGCGCHTVVLGHYVLSVLVLGTQDHIMDLVSYPDSRVDMFSLFLSVQN